MLLDRIFKKVKTYLNTEGRGNVKTERLNLLAHDVIQQRQSFLLYEANRLTNRQNRGLTSNFLHDLPDKISEKLQHYLTDAPLTGTNNKYDLPKDYAHYDDLLSENNTSFEYCRNNREFNILKHQATAKYPVYTIVGRTIKTSHDLSGLTFQYLRVPKKPKWTYTVFENNEMFNPSAPDFVDADIHPSEEDEVVKGILLACGVNLKEQDVVQFAMQENASEFNENNAT